jgi:D-cysteine desulfhydrase family pyridoxal phosphate-dependent enzyme
MPSSSSPPQRIALVNGPTPLERLERLSRHLGGPAILVKRDDMTGLAFGGNKARKLEYLVADALARRATLLVTIGAAGSNHARMTSAAACRVGLKCALVLGGKPPATWQGNELLDRLLGARMRYVERGGDAALVKEARAWMKALRAEGERPYFIPKGGSCGLGALGYVRGARETLADLRRMRSPADAIFVAVGSGGTIAGLAMGLAAHAPPERRPALVGVSVSLSAGRLRLDTGRILREIPRGAPARPRVTPADFELLDRYVGGGYGVSTPESLEAIRLAARLEGLLLDPVYTAKAMAGLIASVREGRFRRGQRVLFIHTGGLPGLFAHARELAAVR